MRYGDIVTDEADKKKKLRRNARRLRLYSEIWRDVVTIIKILVPHDKADQITTRAKGIMVNLIELKTGKRPDKF
jgi:hypothetical protein